MNRPISASQNKNQSYDSNKVKSNVDNRVNTVS